MKTGAILIGILALFVVFVSCEVRHQHNAEGALPPVTFASESDVLLMLVKGDDLVAVEGTGSMQPYIPAGDGIVAYAELNRVAYKQLRAGDLVVYRGSRYSIIHQLDSRDGEGWIVSGLHNSTYDRTRVTESNFVGKVTHTYIVK